MDYVVVEMKIVLCKYNEIAHRREEPSAEESEHLGAELQDEEKVKKNLNGIVKCFLTLTTIKNEKFSLLY